MRKLFLLALLFSAFMAGAQRSDETAIRQVITESYIEGIQNGGSPEQIRKGFHPSFEMLRLMENDVKPYPIEEWIEALEKRKAESTTAQPKAEGKFINIDVTGTAAVVKLELYRAGKKTFTDYLVLYKFNEGWKIVSKTFFRHS